MEALKGKSPAQLAREAGVLAMPGKLAGRGLRFSDHVRRAYISAFQNGCSTTAKAVAYSAVFVIFPSMLVVAACITLLPATAAMRFELALFFNRILPPSVAPLLEDFFINADKSSQSSHVLWGAALVGFTGAAGILATLMEGFRRTYHLPLHAWRSPWQRRIRAYVLLMITFVPITIASVLVVFGHYLTVWFVAWKQPELETLFYFLANVVRWGVALVTTASVEAIVYRYGIARTLPWREVVPGATFSTVTWFLTTLGFGWYVTHYADYSRVYGPLGTGIVLMVWLYLTALSVLCGAELNAELFNARYPKESED